MRVIASEKREWEWRRCVLAPRQLRGLDDACVMSSISHLRYAVYVMSSISQLRYAVYVMSFISQLRHAVYVMSFIMVTKN